MLKLHNTLTKKDEAFTSLKPQKVRFYHCGPTVYWTQHIGNLRAVVLADFMRRWLIASRYKVTFVRNYTDVGHLTGDNVGDADTGEDRMEKASKREGLNPDAIANKYIAQFEEDTAALNILAPTHTPRATEYIQEMITMMETLLEKGFAYTTEKAIYFNVTKVDAYTKLSRQDLDLTKTGAGHGDVADSEKKNPHDFALWFFKTGTHKDALQTRESPFDSPAVENGQGFPGWHMECSAMSKALLGDTLDIHMGGIEHIPIHHTNEIAQSEAANGTTFVNYWLHNEHLLVDGAKMSKSEGTSYLLQDVINKGFDPLVLRYFFLGAHYRSKQNFTWKALQASENALERLRTHMRKLLDTEPSDKPVASYVAQFKVAMNDDFNTPQALAVLWELLKDKKASPEDLKATLFYFDTIFGLKLDEVAEEHFDIPEKITQLAEAREKARKEKMWDKADALRNEIAQKGYTVKDENAGYSLYPHT